MTTEILSVVIPVRDDASQLGQAIASIRAQDRDNVEIIVVDDGSVDDSAQAASQHGADRVVSLDSNLGPSMARNIGLALASGELVTFLDSDDRMFPERLRRQEEWLVANPGMSGVIGDQYFEVASGASLPSWHRTFGLADRRSGGSAISVMVRLRSLLEHGGFDPSFRTAEDLELLMRLERGGAHTGHIREPLTVKTIHGTNATYATEAMRSGHLRAVQRLAKPPSSPAISVIIPVFEAGRYLAAAVESVRKQSVSELEIVIVDDGSSDDSLAIAQELEARDPVIRAFGQPHAGPGAARNLGLLVARGRYIALLDADDLWTPGKLQMQLERLSEDATVDFVFGIVEEFVSEDLPSEVAQRLRARPAGIGHIPSALLAQRTAMARIGPFPTGLVAADWAEWYARAVEMGGNIASIADVVTKRRLHETNHSLVRETAKAQYLGVLRRSLARRKGPV